MKKEVLMKIKKKAEKEAYKCARSYMDDVMKSRKKDPDLYFRKSLIMDALGKMQQELTIPIFNLLEGMFYDGFVIGYCKSSTEEVLGHEKKQASKA